MATTRRRDNAYWLARLGREHPSIYSKLTAGEIPSVRQAVAAAGMTRLPGRLDALKREWKGASTAEREEFMRWVENCGGSAPTVSSAKAKWRSKAKPIADSEGRLTERGKERLVEVLKRIGWAGAGGLKLGKLMQQLGRPKVDASIGNAVHRGSRLNPT